MNPQQLAQQAQTAATQGQQMVASDQQDAANNTNAYNTYQSQASAANTALQKQAALMNGSGSGQNVYNSELGTLTNQYDPNLGANMSKANANLAALSGALNGANQQFNTPGGVGAYGLTAPVLASYESAALSPLQAGMNTANNQVNNYNNQLGTLGGMAGNATTAQVQTEQNASLTLQASLAGYQQQATQAASQIQFFKQLASSQGGLNASEQASYGASIASLASAQNALAQAALANAQAPGQAAVSKADQNQLNDAYQMKANGSGGYNFFQGNTPITVQQYNAGTKSNLNTETGL